MKVAYINGIAAHEGREVTLRGWLHNRRSSGRIHFLTVRDGTGFIQAVMSKAAVGADVFRQADHLGQETAIRIRGLVRADARAPGGYEIDVAHLEQVGPSQNYPITPKEHGVEYLLDHRHLWLRSERQQAILRIRHEVIDCIRTFFNERGFVLVDTPILTPAACEGTTTLFPVPYFDDATAFLTQSGQLYNEANAMALGRVYCFGPTFRAEKSKTRRHLTEFWMVEPEMAYAALDEVIVLAEALVAAVIGRVLDTRRRELAVLERDTAPLERVRTPFPRVSYDEAVEILRQRGLPFEWGGDFGSPGRDGARRAFRSAGYRPPLPGGREGLLHEGRSGAAGGVAFGRRAGAGGVRRDHRRRTARGRLRRTLRARAGARSTRGGVLVVSGPPALRQRPRTAASEWASKGSSPGCAGLAHVREAIPYPRMLHRLTP